MKKPLKRKLEKEQNVLDENQLNNLEDRERLLCLPEHLKS